MEIQTLLPATDSIGTDDSANDEAGDGQDPPVADDSTCADWLKADADTRRLQVLAYEIDYGDPQPTKDSATLIKLITNACKSYGTDETPRHIAKISIATVYGK